MAAAPTSTPTPPGLPTSPPPAPTEPLFAPPPEGIGIEPDGARRLERKGRWWIFASFIACPCHLPITLAVLAAVFAGTSLGAVVRDHAWVAGTIITLTWVAGTAYGFSLVRRANRANGACPLPKAKAPPR